MRILSKSLMGFISRTFFGSLTVGDFSPVVMMGIINLSPESFYKGSYKSPTSLLETVQKFINNGAKILDLGARSTWIKATPITLEDEKNRIIAALDLIKGNIPSSVIISIDTQYSEVAKMALDFAKQNNIHLMINDVSSFHVDPKLLDVVVEYNCPVVIMATKEKPGDTRTVEEILVALNNTIMALSKKGYDISQLIIDPGIGKWTAEKTYEYDLAMIDHLRDFRCFECPILVGLSRKSFIGEILSESDPAKRDLGSLAATSIAVYNGGHIIRTHDVDLAMKQTIETAEAIKPKPLRHQIGNQIAELLGSFENPDSAYYLLRQYGVTPYGARIMKTKMITKIMILKHVTAPQGLIIKQEMLARGGDIGLHRDVVTTEWAKYEEKFDIVIIGTIKQFQSLITKLKGQQLNLDKIGQLIAETLNLEKNMQKHYNKSY